MRPPAGLPNDTPMTHGLCRNDLDRPWLFGFGVGRPASKHAAPQTSNKSPSTSDASPFLSSSIPIGHEVRRRTEVICADNTCFRCPLDGLGRKWCESPSYKPRPSSTRSPKLHHTAKKGHTRCHASFENGTSLQGD